MLIDRWKPFSIDAMIFLDVILRCCNYTDMYHINSTNYTPCSPALAMKSTWRLSNGDFMNCQIFNCLISAFMVWWKILLTDGCSKLSALQKSNFPGGKWWSAMNHDLQCQWIVSICWGCGCIAPQPKPSWWTWCLLSLWFSKTLTRLGAVLAGVNWLWLGLRGKGILWAPSSFSQTEELVLLLKSLEDWSRPKT